MAKPPIPGGWTEAQHERHLLDSGWYDNLPAESRARAERKAAGATPPPPLSGREYHYPDPVLMSLLAAISGLAIGLVAGAGGIWVCLGMVTPC